MRRILALIAAFTVCLAAPATAGGPNNVVIASPTADASQIHRSAVQAATTGADDVDSGNLALARPHDCTGCEGIAVAFQAIIATGSPSTVRPTNAAVAANSACTQCGAFAYAYQYYVTADRGARLSDAARDGIDIIRQQAAALVDDGLPYDELDTALDALAVKFHDTVLQGLQQDDANPRGGETTTRLKRSGTSEG
jgi:putative peptide zinc metalloprotease protein